MQSVYTSGQRLIYGIIIITRIVLLGSSFILPAAPTYMYM